MLRTFLIIFFNLFIYFITLVNIIFYLFIFYYFCFCDIYVAGVDG
jgi:hypothetical protein